jgi:NIMA (never in mitosis gene a)-related kinase
MPKRQYDRGLAVEHRGKPKHRWEVLQSLGKMNGGLNAGIYKVSPKDKARGMVFIEKRFGPVECREKVAHREIQILHQVSDHPSITTMVDHFLDPPRLTGAVFLEYCDKGSLGDVTEHVMRGKHVNEHKVWSWFIQLTEALIYCHFGPHPEMSATELLQSGWSKVYHRDIKPGNILLTTEANQIVAKLADFGCAVSEDYIALYPNLNHAVTASMCTPGFDAPEYPFFSGASDIWQLAISIMCLCTGIVSPLSAKNPRGQPWNVARPAGPEYSKELSWAMKACLEKNINNHSPTLPELKYLNKQYEAVIAQLPPDHLPLEIFLPRGGQIPQGPQYGPMPVHGQMGPAPGFAQFPSPEFGGPFGYFLGGQGPVPAVNPMAMPYSPVLGESNPRRRQHRRGFRF